jgi:hypothetical protein
MTRFSSLFITNLYDFARTVHLQIEHLYIVSKTRYVAMASAICTLFSTTCKIHTYVCEGVGEHVLK